jgi:hypothetical protein
MLLEQHSAVWTEMTRCVAVVPLSMSLKFILARVALVALSTIVARLIVSMDAREMTSQADRLRIRPETFRPRAVPLSWHGEVMLEQCVSGRPGVVPVIARPRPGEQ